MSPNLHHLLVVTLLGISIGANISTIFTRPFSGWATTTPARRPRRELRRLLRWSRVNAALVLTLLIGWVAFHVLVQVPPADVIEIALETEPGHPDAEGHVTHVLAACAPYSELADSQTSCLVAYADHGSPRLRQLHFQHSGQLTPEAWDLWAIINQEPHS